MKPVDLVILAVIVVILGLAALCICRARKSGKKCIGCPDNCACSGGNCSGGCTGCQTK